MKKFYTATLLISLVLISNYTFSQTKIEKSKEELKKENSKTNTNSSSTNTTNTKNCNTEKSLLSGLPVIEAIVTVPIYVFIGDYRNEKQFDLSLTPYPYYDKVSGNYEYLQALEHQKKARIDIENNLLLNKDETYGNHFKLKLRPSKDLFIQTDYFELIEKNKTKNKFDNLSLFNFNLCYDRIRSRHFNLGWSLGVNYIANDVQKVGFTYGLHTDIFIAKAFNVYAAARWSQVNQKPVNSIELLYKYYKNKFNFSLGYQYIKIASPNYHFLTIGAGVCL